jgi:DNA-directed RNA polymerase specialized sigma24 family protein
LSNMTYIEIAELLEIPLGTVQTRANRGKPRLRSCLKSKDIDESVLFE